jgi:hypothetical protein
MGSHAIVKGIVLMTISMAHVKLDLSASALLQLKKCTILTQVCQNLNTPMAVCHLKKRVSCKYALISSFIDEFQLQEDIFFLQCKGHLVPHLVPKSIQCCHQSDNCNRLLSPMYEIRSTTPDPNSGFGSNEHVHYLALLVSVTASVIILFVMVVCVYLQ